MRIKINDKFAIGGDQNCWEHIAWYIPLQATVNGLVDLSLRCSDAQTLSEALLEVEKLTASLCMALQPMYEVKRRAA